MKFLQRINGTSACVAVCLAFIPTQAPGQVVNRGDVMHWAFASYFGTGWYSVEGGGEVYALRVNPGWSWREPGIDDDGNRTIGYQLRVPVTLGLHKFDLRGDLGEIIDLDNASTISFVPGLEIEIPINSRWSLKPLAYAGWGTEFNGDSSAWIYWAGLKSRVAFRNGNVDWALVNSLVYVGHSPSEGRSQDLVPFLTAFEFDHPMGNLQLQGDQLYLNWHIAYTKILNEPGVQFDFEDIGNVFKSTASREIWEVGVAFSKRERLSWWRLSVDRIGIALRAGRGGNYEGIAITFNSIFDR